MSILFSSKNGESTGRRAMLQHLQNRMARHFLCLSSQGETHLEEIFQDMRNSHHHIECHIQYGRLGRRKGGGCGSMVVGAERGL